MRTILAAVAGGLSCLSCVVTSPYSTSSSSATETTSANKNPTTALEVLSLSDVDADPFKKTKWVRGPLYSMGGYEEWLLRALLTEDGSQSVVVQLYAILLPRNESWAFFDSAADETGLEFEVLPIDKDTTTLVMSHKVLTSETIA